jgi:hypothetical protein
MRATHDAAASAATPAVAASTAAPGTPGAAAARGEPLVHVGDARIRGDRLPRGDWRWTLRGPGPNGQVGDIGTQREVLRDITWNGRPALLREMTMQMQGFTLVDSTITDRVTLAPLAHRGRNPRRALALDFAGARVTGTMTPVGAAPVPIDRTTPEPGFDSSGFDQIAPALGLRAGESVRLPAFVYEKPALQWYVVRATAGADGTLRLEIAEDAGVPFARLHIDPATRRTLDYAFVFPNGRTLDRVP